MLCIFSAASWLQFRNVSLALLAIGSISNVNPVAVCVPRLRKSVRSRNVGCAGKCRIPQMGARLPRYFHSSRVDGNAVWSGFLILRSVSSRKLRDVATRRTFLTGDVIQYRKHQIVSSSSVTAGVSLDPRLRLRAIRPATYSIVVCPSMRCFFGATKPRSCSSRCFNTRVKSSSVSRVASSSKTSTWQPKN